MSRWFVPTTDGWRDHTRSLTHDLIVYIQTNQIRRVDPVIDVSQCWFPYHIPPAYAQRLNALYEEVKDAVDGHAPNMARNENGTFRVNYDEMRDGFSAGLIQTAFSAFNALNKEICEGLLANNTLGMRLLARTPRRNGFERAIMFKNPYTDEFEYVFESPNTGPWIGKMGIKYVVEDVVLQGETRADIEALYTKYASPSAFESSKTENANRTGEVQKRFNEDNADRWETFMSTFLQAGIPDRPEEGTIKFKKPIEFGGREEYEKDNAEVPVQSHELFEHRHYAANDAWYLNNGMRRFVPPASDDHPVYYFPTFV